MRAFRIAGTFRMGERQQAFTQEVAAASTEEAVEKVLSVLGSRHRTKRKNVHVHEVTEIGAEEVRDAVVEHLLREG